MFRQSRRVSRSNFLVTASAVIAFFLFFDETGAIKKIIGPEHFVLPMRKAKSQRTGQRGDKQT